jgi:hypothetical protein
MILIIFAVALNPFYAGNFTSLAEGATGIYENPAGLGLTLAIEDELTFHRDSLVNGLLLKNIGLGLVKHDTLLGGEAGIGYRLPGAFAFGYAYQFGIKGNLPKTHIFGVSCRPSSELSLGFKTTIGKIKHLFGGGTVKPLGEYVFLNIDFEYEGMTDLFHFYWGGMIRLSDYINIYVHADDEFNWTAGMGLGYSKLRVAASYSADDRQIGAGLILSE